jgi:micrococcal nuclease
MKQSLLIILTILTLNCFGTITKVTRVIDGDTFETEAGEKVRLVGINAPEISDLFGEEAKEHLSQLIGGKTIELLPDNISNDRDRYNRLLRYVILDGIDINKKMVLDGFAFAYLKYHFNKSNEYEQAQIQAREMSTGIWSDKKKETIIREQEKREISVWQNISPKAYFVGSLVIVLLIVGIYTYFKKN